MIQLERLDHLVMPCDDVQGMCDFYVRVLGMRKVAGAGGRLALHYGPHKINLQHAGHFEGLCAPNHLAGTQDFCLVSTTPSEEVAAHLQAQGVEVIDGPVTRAGALGEMTSVYFRDPEGNLVEISNYNK